MDIKLLDLKQMVEPSIDVYVSENVWISNRLLDLKQRAESSIDDYVYVSATVRISNRMLTDSTINNDYMFASMLTNEIMHYLSSVRSEKK